MLFYCWLLHQSLLFGLFRIFSVHHHKTYHLGGNKFPSDGHSKADRSTVNSQTTWTGHRRNENKDKIEMSLGCSFFTRINLLIQLQAVDRQTDRVLVPAVMECFDRTVGVSIKRYGALHCGTISLHALAIFSLN